jgi:hypothetical protein
MLSTNTNFDALHDLDNKTPIYHATFSRSGWSPDFSTICTQNATDTDYKTLIESISGGNQNVAPDKGTASISGYTITLIDDDDEFLEFIASDEAQLQNVKCVIKAGYLGNAAADLLTVFTGYVSSLKETSDHTGWIVTVADPSKKLQKHIAWEASDASPIVKFGNPIDLILKILTSTGAGTNGDYDVWAADMGVGLNDDLVDVSGLEAIRDLWFPGTSHNLYFSLTDHIKAKQLIEAEILKVINCYPRIDGQGRYSIIPFKPTMAIYNVGSVQSFTTDNIIEWTVDLNFREMINEVEIKYNWNGSEFLTIEHWADGTSINLRSVGNAPMVIESKGMNIVYNPRADIMAENRKTRILARYSTPPLKLNIKTFLEQWLTEAGDIVPITHAKIRDPIAGSVGVSNKSMEVVKRSIDWKRGTVALECIETGFSSNQYAVISPCMTVVTGTSATEFEVSSGDAAKFADFTDPEVTIHKLNGAAVATVTITDITGTTITVDSIGETPAAGWTARFAGYDDATSEQTETYGYICDDDDYLGTADDECHIITP